MGRQRPPLGFAVLLFALFPLGCAVARPSPEALVATGFRAPEQTFQTFQAALAADLVDLEYRCFSAGFRRREGMTQLGYRAYRAELLSRWPALRRLATASILRSEAVAPDRWRIVGRVRHLGVRADFELELVREDFFELYEGNELSYDGSFDWDGLASVQGGAQRPRTHLAARVPLSEPVDLERLTEVRLGREWKIDAIARIDP